MGKCPADAAPIIGGNFNASIGTANADEELLNSPVGCHGNPHRNDNGDKIRDLINNHGLCSIAQFLKSDATTPGHSTAWHKAIPNRSYPCQKERPENLL
mgnify:CR=1 FL=1